MSEQHIDNLGVVRHSQDTLFFHPAMPPAKLRHHAHGIPDQTLTSSYHGSTQCKGQQDDKISNLYSLSLLHIPPLLWAVCWLWHLQEVKLGSSGRGHPTAIERLIEVLLQSWWRLKVSWPTSFYGRLYRCCRKWHLWQWRIHAYVK